MLQNEKKDLHSFLHKKMDGKGIKSYDTASVARSVAMF